MMFKLLAPQTLRLSAQSMRSLVAAPRLSAAFSTASSGTSAQSAQAEASKKAAQFPYRQDSAITNKTLKRSDGGRPIDRKNRSLFCTQAGSKEAGKEAAAKKAEAFPYRQDSHITNKTETRSKEGRPVDRKHRSL